MSIAFKSFFSPFLNLMVDTNSRYLYGAKEKTDRIESIQ